MRLEENKVYVFSFDSSEMGGGCSFPIRASSREEASDVLQKCLSRFQTELAMEFPRIGAPAPSSSVNVPQDAGFSAPAGIPPEVLEMRIDTLLKDLGGAGLTATAKAETIKNWTELDYTVDNFPKIITELELLASGQKEVPVKPKKK